MDRLKWFLNFFGQGGSSGDTLKININELPENVLVQVLSHVPGKDLISCCRLVCSIWKDVIDLPTLWKRKCALEGFLNKEAIRNSEDWRNIYFLLQKKKNLIKNPCAAERLKYWNLDDTSDGNFAIEKLPGHHGQPFLQPHVKKYFVTSYRVAYKYQIIDLMAEGYWQKLMDEMQPDIVVTDWYAARRDCGCWYQLCVQLLSADYIVLQEFQPERVTIEQWSDAKWNQMSHIFQSYGPGVRYIKFHHGGCDTQFWAGWYGVRVTNSSLVIQPPEAEGQ